MGRHRYTLKAYDESGNNEFVIPLQEDGIFREKNYLTTIDKFMLSHKTNEGCYENIKSKEELLTYLNKYYKTQIPLSSIVYITYQSDKEEKRLEVIYDTNPVLQYLCHFYIYFNQRTNSREKVKKELRLDPVWQRMTRNFLSNLKNPTYYEFLMYKEGKEFLTPSLKRWIKDYVNFYDYEILDERVTFEDALKAIKNGLSSYKTLRGIELSYQKYNQLYKQKLGLTKNDILFYLENQLINMPIEQSIYFGKNYQIPNYMMKTGYDELDEVIGDNITSISELSKQVFEELGLTLDDLENYPKLKEKLGFPTDALREKYSSKRK